VLGTLHLKLKAQLSDLLHTSGTSCHVTMETTDVKTKNKIIIVVIDDDCLCIVPVERPTNVSHTLGVICDGTQHIIDSR